MTSTNFINCQRRLSNKEAPVVGANSLLLRVRSSALQDLEDVFGFKVGFGR